MGASQPQQGIVADACLVMCCDHVSNALWLSAVAASESKLQ
jgi:hypothetical protein